jgi:sugar porter (SP) family MFS transporter
MRRSLNREAASRAMPFVYLVAAVGALGGALFGYDTGAISGAILYLKQQFALSSGLQELVTSIALAGATLGAAIGGPLADRYGRRKVITADAAVFVAGSIATGLAQSVPWLIGGRLLIGSAIGIASFVSPLYLSEMAPASIRGALVSLNQVAITAGILISYLVDYAFARPGGWHWMFALGAVPALALGLGIFLMPPSPRWLMMQGRKADARRTLTRLRGAGPGVDAELAEIETSLAHQHAGFTALLSPGLRAPMTIGIVLAALQQVTGINTVIYYAPTIFQSAGFGSAEASIVATIGVGIVNLLATLVAVWLLDRTGRRPLLLLGEAGMAASLVLLGFGFLAHGQSTGWITAAGLMIYVGFFAIGLGPVFWLLISEIYPLQVRGLAMSVATLVNWVMNLLVALSFLTLVDRIGQSAVFWAYAALSALAFVFTWSYVPETKGKTLEQIQAHWRQGGHPLALQEMPNRPA